MVDVALALLDALVNGYEKIDKIKYYYYCAIILFRKGLPVK
jgi:hypothetical protein